MIYVIRTVGVPFVKIGYTSENIKGRLGTMQTGCPFELELIAYCPGERDLEYKETSKVVHSIRTLGKNGSVISIQQMAKRQPLRLLPSFIRNRPRLGRILEYAQRTPSPITDSPTSPTGVAEALQPNTSIA